MNCNNNKENISHTKIILASASPRRKELLAQIGLEFQVLAGNVDEKITTKVPSLAVEQLSRQKARACADGLRQNGSVIVIGADTVVACGGEIMGKPSCEEEALRMLRLLQGSSHQVYTGVTLIYREQDSANIQEKTFHEATTVHFYPMTDEEIAGYVSTGEPMDKAGAYGIQGLCAKYIKGIEGDYNNVVGLPVARLYQEAKDWL